MEYTARVLELRGDDATDAAEYRDTVQLLKVPTGGQPWVRKEYVTATEFLAGDRALFEQQDALPTKETPFFATSDDGAFVHDESGGAKTGPLYPAWIQALPRDPGALLDALQHADHETAGAGSGWQVMNTVGTILDSGVADGRLQAAIWTALRTMPDLTVIDRHAEDLTGRTGVLIGLKPSLFNTIGASRSTELLVDPATGAFLGERIVSLHADGVVPAGTVLLDRAVTLAGTADPEDWTVPAGSKEYDYR